ncbi:CYTH domain-containing protein [Thioalkalivibrio thiocyanodenitrificans]|uniref:CYTH domain-containing protein n=1 Tax=Thioalkalivibrio thiocyanodenitrificans TaxID=243063 RepID=UPI0003809BCB|nr:CYTH domain-containing protein [Thioalkalivibrio thiocyanodenitrificans]
MAQEIERKFLVIGDSWRHLVSRSVQYQQGYLCGNARSSIRIRVSDESGYLNIKSATLGVRREEFEYPVPLPDARHMLELLCEGPLIEKTRHFVEYRGHVWEVDVFEGQNQGLVVAEVELSSEDETFERPDWIGEEVSHDARYYNTSLVRHPYTHWT